jgi:hypothetical protein
MAHHRTHLCLDVYVPCPHDGCPAKTEPTYKRWNIIEFEGDDAYEHRCDYKPISCKKCQEVGGSSPHTCAPARPPLDA